MNELGFESKHGKQFRSARACGAVGTVDDDLSSNFWGRDSRFKPSLVAFTQITITRQSREDLGTCIQAGSTIFNQAKNFLFDGQFNFVGELIAIAAEDLYPIIRPGIVGGRDHDASIEIQLANQVCDAWSGDNTSRRNFCRPGSKASSNRIRDPCTRFACILANHNARAALVAREMMPERAPNGKDRAAIEGEFPGNSANSVGTKEFSAHEQMQSLNHRGHGRRRGSATQRN